MTARRAPPIEARVLPDVAFLAAVRARSTRLAGALLGIAALASGVALVTSAITAEWALVSLADRVRDATGLAVPTHGRDWYLLGVVALTLAVPAALVLAGAVAYRRLWNRRLAETWGTDRPPRHLTAMPRRHEPDHSVRHLRSLLEGPGWAEQWRSWSDAPPTGFPARVAPRSFTADDHRAVAPSMLAVLHRDIADRALIAGLAVGLSHRRFFDHLAIIGSALELQLHVLARLGKRPSLRTWRTMFRYCGASLFVNHYLDREDAYAVRLGIRSAAMGFETLAKLLDESGDALADLDMDEIVDDVADVIGLDRAGLGATALRLLGTSAVLGSGAVIGVGEVGLHQIAELTRDLGDDLLQGVLAASILAFHGMSLAADVLATDPTHREDLSPGFTGVVAGMREAAGRLARQQVRMLRAAYARQRREAYARLPEQGRKALADRFAARRDRMAGGADPTGETGRQ